MTSGISQPAAAAGVTLLAAVLLWLNAWEAEVARLRRRGDRLSRLGEEGGPAGTLAPRGAVDALEVHLAAWGYAAALVWLGGTIGPRTWDSGASGPLQLLPLAGLLLALVLIFAGRQTGRHRGFPAILRWPIQPYHGLAGWLIWLWGLARSQRRSTRQIEEEPAGNGTTPPDVHDGVRDLASMTVEEVLIPRSQVVALAGTCAVREAIEEVRRNPHAVYPVYGESVDQILGVVRILDLAGAENLGQPIRDLVRPAPIVPETMMGMSLLEQLCGAVIPAALVVDEFGGMAGLVTVEDLVEVLVGDLVGEHEVVRARILPLPDGGFRVEGTTTVEEFNAWFGDVLPDGEYETVAGFFLDRVGEIPQVGETVETPGAILEVLERTERRILWLKASVNLAGASAPVGAPPERAARVPRG